MSYTKHCVRACVCRTSSTDGCAIAWAVCERIGASGAQALFATHFFELTVSVECCTRCVAERLIMLTKRMLVRLAGAYANVSTVPAPAYGAFCC